MSAYSEWKAGLITDDQYKSSYAKEQWEQDHPYDFEPDNPEYTCENCEFCKLGLCFVREPVIRQADNRVVIRETKRECYTHYCARDIEHIKEINTYDPVCDDHGDLFTEDE